MCNEIFNFPQVEIETSVDEVQPGVPVDLTIKSKPYSFVGLLGIDQRSILLKSGNDISYVRIFILFKKIRFRIINLNNHYWPQ